jgi:hypothetical protein
MYSFSDIPTTDLRKHITVYLCHLFFIFFDFLPDLIHNVKSKMLQHTGGLLISFVTLYNLVVVPITKASTART